MFPANVQALLGSNIREDADVNGDVRVGDRVRLLGIPDWLLHDLPENEQAEIRSCVGGDAVVCEIDAHGYFWIGFGFFEESSGLANYSGHSFCVTREFLEKL